MKKKLCTLFLFLVFIVPVFGQQFDFTAKVDTVKNAKGEKSVTITIDIQGGLPGFDVYCVDGLPSTKSKVLCKGMQISERKYQVTGISIPVFYICVVDRNNKLIGHRSDSLSR